jgi:hypothetical protein
MQRPTHLQNSPLFNRSFTGAVSLRHIHNQFGVARVYVNRIFPKGPAPNNTPRPTVGRLSLSVRLIG